jgi:hypothetical protein
LIFSLKRQFSNDGAFDFVEICLKTGRDAATANGAGGGRF